MDVATRSLRQRVETVLRVGSLLLLGVLVAQAVKASTDRPSRRANSAELPESLVLWSTRESPERVHVAFDSTPSATTRDWLAALSGTGTRTSWSGDSLVPTALAVEPVADPRHPSRIWVAAPAGAHIAVTDDLGAVDSATAGPGGALFRVPALTGTARAIVGGSTAVAPTPDSLTVRPVLVLGIAGWESKFIVASLEEWGWKVNARLALAPTGDVTLGPSVVRLDTAHYSAVIALDSSAMRHLRRIGEYVRSGGGLIAVGDAAGARGLLPLLPARAMGSASRPGVFTTDSSDARRSLALSPLVRLHAGAIPLENRDNDVAIAAHRVGNGRVLQLGYRDTWRWRMGGPKDPVAAYRAWWSDLVSKVAYAPRNTVDVVQPMEPTPLASLVATLGARSPAIEVTGNPWRDPRLTRIMFGVLLGMLVLEWASRRLGGRP